MAAEKRRTGRRPGTSGVTREQILRAARSEFAAKGFKGATTRAIAEAAGVNIALIAHYFGSKHRLFAETLELPGAALEKISPSLAGDRDGRAERLTRADLGGWEDPDTREQLIATVRSALSGGEATERLSELLTGALRTVSDLDPEQEVGLALATSNLLGTAIARYVTGLAPLVNMPFEELVRRSTCAVRAHLELSEWEQ